MQQQQEHHQSFSHNFPPVEILNKNHSLQADMATGWRPKFSMPGPIPLNFDSNVVDAVVEELTSFGSKYRERVVYLGQRHSNTFEFHQQHQHSYRFKYDGLVSGVFSHMAPYFRKFHANFSSKNKNGRLFKGMNPTLKSSEEPIFDSNFQSGNLDTVIKVADYQYDLFMRVDTNTRGHVQWFNFKVKNNNMKKIKLNIVNFRKIKTLYSRGMKPYIFSENLKQRKNKGWHQGGLNVKYQKKILRYRFLEELFHEDYISFNCLQFQYEFSTQWETVQFAYCPPFTYSEMLQTIKNLKEDILNRQTRNFITEKNLCESLGGLDIPILTITDPEVEKKRKKCILVWGRIHPGETCGSHMLNGLLNYLCSDKEDARELRRQAIWKVIPMLNPDGVVAGNFRTNLCGRDLNRQFKAQNTFLLPQVKAVKEYVTKLKNQYRSRLLLFLDMHGHSVKKNVFLYGPQYQIWQNNYYHTRILPKIISSKTQMFRYYSCLFRIADFKRTTARAVLLNMIPHCYTIQASTGFHYSASNKKNNNFIIEEWQSMGKIIGESVFEYLQLFYHSQITKSQRQQRLNQFKIVKKPTAIKALDAKNGDKYQTRAMNISLSQNVKNVEKKQQKSQGKKLQIFTRKAREIIEQIKNQQRISIKSEGHSSDNFSQGGSDSESSVDDIPQEELQYLHRKIMDSMNQFQDKFFNGDKNESMKKKRLEKSMRQSPLLKPRRGSRGLEMIASLRKKAQEIQKNQNLLIGKKIKSEYKNKTTHLQNLPNPSYQNHRVRMSFQTYLSQFQNRGKKKQDQSSMVFS